MENYKCERAGAANPCPFGTFGTAPADSASRAEAVPKARDDRSSRTFGFKNSLNHTEQWMWLRLEVFHGVQSST